MYLVDLLNDIERNDRQHALGDPQRVPRLFNELPPENEVEQEEDHHVASEENCVLFLCLIEVEED